MVLKMAEYKMSDYVFPNRSNGKPMSNAGMSSVLKRLDELTVTFMAFVRPFVIM